MVTRPSTLFFTVRLCVFLATPFPYSDATQDSSLPYIYYYADTLNSFVVERVDGSDSRVLAELPPEQINLYAEHLPAGTSIYSYQVRAAVSGEFQTILTFYFPEVFGRSSGT